MWQYSKPVDGDSPILGWLKPLPEKPSELPRSKADIETIVDDLVKWRLVFISCPDEAYLEATGYQVVEHLKLANTRQWVLHGTSSQTNADFPVLLRDLPWLPGPDGEADHPQLLLAKMTDSNSFAAVLRDFNCVTTDLELLRNRKAFFVFLLYPQVVPLLAAPPANPAFRHWPIPGVLPRPAAVSKRPSEPEPPFMELVKRGLFVERAALFATAFLGQLSRRDFDTVMKVLIEGEKERPYRNAPGVAASTQHDGRLEHIERSAVDVWNDDKGSILDTVGISIEMVGAKQMVCFRAEYTCAVQDAFRRHIDGPRPFFSKLFKKLLFDEISEDLLGKLIDTARAMVALDPDEFGSTWLEGLIDKFVQEEQALLAQGGGNLVLHSLLQLVNASTRERFYIRIALLCETLYPDSQTRQPVEELFGLLLRNGEHDPLCELVFRLRAVKGFTYFSWLQRLLNEGRLEVKGVVLQHLVDQAGITPDRCTTILREIRRWLPPVGDPKPATQAQIYCLPFPVALVSRLNDIFERQEQRGISPRFPLPLPLPDADPSRWIAEWLVHDRLPEGLATVSGEDITASEPFIADVLERIALLAIRSADADIARPEVERLRDLVCGRLPRNRWLRVLQRWAERAADVRLSLTTLPRDRSNEADRKRLQRNFDALQGLKRSALLTSNSHK